jgi:hypothetical protein
LSTLADEQVSDHRGRYAEHLDRVSTHSSRTRNKISWFFSATAGYILFMYTQNAVTYSVETFRQRSAILSANGSTVLSASWRAA